MVEPARLAIARSALGGMILSLLPMRYHDGIVFHAGTPDGSFNAPIVAGRCVAATIAFCLALRPVANDAKTVDFLRYRSVAAVGGRVAGTKSNTVVGSTESAES